jgi:hypothetical protein
MRTKSFFVAAALTSSAFAATSITIVDVVPASLSSERAQNSEPNISVNPANPQQIMISAFGNSDFKNPIFFSNDGGANWSLFQYTRVSDQTLAWSDKGAFIAELSPSAARIFVGVQRHPTAARHQFHPLPVSLFAPSVGGPDQPWIDVVTVNIRDHIYVAFNDLSVPSARTAAIRFSLDDGLHWRNVHIDRGSPRGQDLPPVRVKAQGNTVYGVFERPSSNPPSGDVPGDLVIVRDDNAGRDRFKALGAAGVVVSANELFPQGFLGQERLGSDLSIAVDPNNPARVAVAFGATSGGLPLVALRVSINSGASWTEVYTTPTNCGLPAVAIATNGTIGLLYTRLAAGNLETHLVESADTFAKSTDFTLSRFPDGTPDVVFDPYIGDYMDLVAVGDTFYGTFCASNDVSAFPITPTFLRDTSALGTTVPFSIDPFFFATDAVSGP